MTQGGLIDFHCHLDLYPDHAEAVAECERAGVFTLAVTTTPRAWPRNHELASATKYVRAALGLHPQLVAERAHELSVWEEHLSKTRYIGEVGLDAGPKFYRSFDLQKQVFKHVLRASAEAGDKILSIHSVRAVKAVLDMIEEDFPVARGKAVLHWFTGTQAEARRAIDLGCYFSVNSAMLGRQDNRALIASLPLERLLTETDGPFVQVNGHPARPADVATTVEVLAVLNSISVAEMVDVVRDNLKCLLGG